MLKVESLGFGRFSHQGIFKGVKCSLCPHKEITWKPMKVVSIYLMRCSWTLNGLVVMKSGVSNVENLHNQWFAVDDIDNKIVEEQLFGKKWEYVDFLVRPLVTAC